MAIIITIVLLLLLYDQQVRGFRTTIKRGDHVTTCSRMAQWARKIDVEADSISRNSAKIGKGRKKGKGVKKKKGKLVSKDDSSSELMQVEARATSQELNSSVDSAKSKLDFDNDAKESEDIMRQSLGDDEPSDLWEKSEGNTNSDEEKKGIPFRAAMNEYEEGEEGEIGEELTDTGFELIDSSDVLTTPPVKYGNQKGGAVPPAEVVFFGEPRRPPPIEALRDTRYHGPLLSWARHANVVPRTSEERSIHVFPRPESSNAEDLYLSEDSFTYKQVFDKFVSVKDNLELSKRFILVNVANIPPKLFLRALTAEKLSAQSKGDMEQMKMLKEVRDAYILAHDQLYFPLNIELQKAETRVMTYVGRMEMFDVMKDWDRIELSTFFTTLLAARLTWDGRVRDVLGQIESKVQNTVQYMAEGIRSDLMTRTFKKPGQSAEIYRNATMVIQSGLPEVYESILPELRAIHETYFLVAEGELDAAKEYLLNEFLPKNNLERKDFMRGLRVVEASLAAMQGIDYIELRLMMSAVHELLCDNTELLARDKWYADFRKDPRSQFQTYETDDIPMMIKSEQRLRDTGNALDNFLVQVMKKGTKYSTALSGARPKGKQVGNWLERDPDWKVPQPASIDERIDNFRKAYVEQTERRKLEENIQLFQGQDRGESSK